MWNAVSRVIKRFPSCAAVASAVDCRNNNSDDDDEENIFNKLQINKENTHRFAAVM